jgi:hypothetical protein
LLKSKQSSSEDELRVNKSASYQGLNVDE